MVRWLTADEASQILGVSKWSVYEMARQNKIGHKRIGRAVRFDPHDVLPEQPSTTAQQIDPPAAINVSLLLSNIDHVLIILQQAKEVLEEVQ